MSISSAGGRMVADIYRQYATDPSALDDSFGAVFEGLEGAELAAGARPDPEVMDPYRTALVLGRVIEGYRWRGHQNARLDPLGLAEPKLDADLQLDRELLRLADQQVAPALAGTLGLKQGTVPQILERLDRIYCGTIGFEYMQVRDPVAREWLRRAIEAGPAMPGREARRDAARQLIRADELEAFMHRRFVGKKRFGAEGCESLICALWAVLARGAALGVRSVVMGGTSRARLNQLANVVGKPLHAIFAEVKGLSPVPEGVRASGDVAYHQGFRGEQQVGGVTVSIDYTANPSHLETVDGVAAGRLRAMQEARGGAGWREALGLVVHTDAAFAGQGIVAEVAQLSALRHYSVGGTIHVIVNNQVGFTTDPADGRSSAYCSDLARAVGSPVFHVNGDDVDAVIRVGQLAAEYRQRFGQDAIIDLVCYRRRGHNEMDEPSFTQPLMAARIAGHPTTRRLYLDRLAAEGAVTAAEEQSITAAVQQELSDAYEAAQSYRLNAMPEDAWAASPERFAEETAGAEIPTGIDLPLLQALGIAISTAPPGIGLNPKVERVFAERLEMLAGQREITWAFAEGLALGSLASEGTAIRFSGQDTPRGAFSQRHFAVHDTSTGAGASIFANLPSGSAACTVFGSPLSEYATLGFEYGYSLEAPGTLVLWEAQFGDFANVAQPVFDQFIASGEDKWLQQSSLVTLLPHGLEGQGAEHSSGRIERFLQLCAAGNIMVANASTPASYFHLLRRQAKGRRRPLVVFTPKSLLRHRFAVSGLAEFGPGTAFRPVIGPQPGQHRRLVLCSGKLYWELEAARQERNLADVGLVRLEQLYPFPARELAAIFRMAPGAEILWCQEEPRNMGAWDFVDRRIEAVMRASGCSAPWPACIGRPANPSPALGTEKQHMADQARLIEAALTGPSPAR
ncbi:2-oxoglutarate dehydrogenase E1 component [Belnapia rosea]|uniref:2-oxoglutarate dehydrogenase E1 component n=1 Tax=Belnapia rosea TaxID=938405 RepID=UPI0015A3A77A|nr:2-oxoglutarate dehydrogenase E1 component [Belnapia rosea]